LAARLKTNIKRYDQDFKEKFLKDWKKSGKSILIFAKENGINKQTAYNWIKKENRIKFGSGFVKMPIPENLSSISFENKLIIEKGDIKIYLPLNINNEIFQTIINTLRNII